MAQIGAWHRFDSADRSTYPKVNSPIQVRDAIGGTSEGDFLKLVSDSRLLLKPKIIGWRYIKDKRSTGTAADLQFAKRGDVATGQASGL